MAEVTEELEKRKKIGLTSYGGKVQTGLFDTKFHVEGGNLLPKNEEVFHQKKLSITRRFLLFDAVLRFHEGLDAGRQTVLSQTLEGVHLYNKTEKNAG